MNRVRERAAVILAICASGYREGTGTYHAELAIEGEYNTEAGDLARITLNRLPYSYQGRDAYAEAEARLRTGWKP